MVGNCPRSHFPSALAAGTERAEFAEDREEAAEQLLGVPQEAPSAVFGILRLWVCKGGGFWPEFGHNFWPVIGTLCSAASSQFPSFSSSKLLKLGTLL